MTVFTTASIRLIRSIFASIRTSSTLRMASVLSLLLAIGSASVLSAGAQTASYRQGFEVLGGTQIFPSGIAVDTSGNVYLAMPALNDGTVEEIPVSCITGANNATCVKTLGGGFSDPQGVAVDVNGNVYVADTDNDAIKEIPGTCITTANNASCVIPLGSGFKEPYGVAVDASGNVYVADTFKSAVKMIAAGCVATANSGGSCVASSDVASGTFFIPSGIAVDASGDVFVTDADSGLVHEVSAACIAGNNNTACTSTIGGAFDTPYGVSVDASGDVYVADAGNNTVSEVPASCIAAANNASCTVALGGGFDTPYGVAAGAGGIFYVADTSNYEVKEYWSQGSDFGTVQVAAVIPVKRTLDFVFSSGGTIGAPVIVTGGVAGLDFTDAGTGSCTTQGTGHAYNTGDICTVDVNLKPLHPGERNGAVLLESNGGQVLAIGYIHGVGASPQSTFADITAGNFAPSQALSMGGGLSTPMGLAVDGAGNAYVADNGNNVVKKIAGNCFSVGCVTTLSGNFLNAMDMAVDGAGNIYVADTGHNAVKEIPQGCIASGCVQTLGGGFSSPEGVTVDGSGNAYVSDTTSGAVFEIPVGCTTSACVTTVVTGFTSPQGVALDSNGNLYVADNSLNQITEIAPGCSIAACGTRLGGGFYAPSRIAVDASGNIFVADLSLNGVKGIPTGCTSSSCVLTMGSGFTTPYGVALNGSGNLYVSDASGSVVTLLDFIDPPSLNFDATSIGFTSADSPQTVVVLNGGNQSLNFTGLVLGNDFVLNSGGGLVCSSSTMLAADAFCTLPIDFTPVSIGTLSENLALTDNTLNVPATQNTIALSGTGNPAPDTTTTYVSISPSSFATGQTTTVTATVADTGIRATTPTGAVTFSWTCSGICQYDTSGSSNSSSGVLNGGNPVNLVSGVATLSGVSFTTAGTYTVAASYSSNAIETFQSGANSGQSDGNNQATVSWSPATSSIASPASLGTIGLGSSARQMVTFTIAAAGSIGVPVVLTQGATGLDFTDAGDGTCSLNNGSSYGYAASSTCTVDVNFAPQVPGTRFGAVLLKDTSGNTLATAYVYGVDTAPEIGFFPGAQSTLATSANGLGNPQGVALDGSGNLYIADQLNHAIWQTTPGGTTTKVLDLSGLGAGAQPGMLAVDGAGNLYIADSANGAVWQATPSGSGYVLNAVPVASSLNASSGVAVDQVGNVYVANSGGNQILKETLQPNSSYVQSTVVDSTDTPLGTALNTPLAVAVDLSGNVYIADTSNNRIIKETLSGTWTPTLVAGGLDWPVELAVDTNGNVYFANYGQSSVADAGVYEETLQPDTSYVQSVLPTSLSSAHVFGLAIDGSGGIYFTDTTHDTVLKVNYATPPALNFATTAVGFSSTDSPQTVTALNFGNAPLIFSGLATPADFPLASSGGQVCSSSTTLAASASCTLPIDFTPVGSSPYSTTALSENLTLTNNSMNAVSANQPIALTGTGIAPTISLSSPVGATLTAGTVGVAYSVSFTAAGGALPYTYQSPWVPDGLTLTSGGTLSGTPTKAAAHDHIFVTATDANGFSAGKRYTLTIAQGTATFNITPYSVTYDSNPHTATGTATGASALDLSAGLTLTGTTHTSAGTYAVDAWSFHDLSDNYADANGTVSDAIAQASATIGVTGYTVNFDGGPHSATGIATGLGGTVNLGGDLNLTGTIHTGAGTYADAWSFTDPGGNYQSATGPVSDTINILTATATAPAATSFGSVNVASSTSQMVTFTIQTAGAIGMPVVVTQGLTGLDFTDAGDGTCTTANGNSNGYAALATCTVDVSFSPQAPGMRAGAVLLEDNSGNILATAYVHGVGTGPVVGFAPGTQTSISASGMNGTDDVTIDSSGNLYVASHSNHEILKETLSLGSYSQSVLFSGSIGGLTIGAKGVAVDGAGNVYIADTDNNRVLVETLSNGSYALSSTFSSGLDNPDGVAVDGSGNVYIANSGGNTVLVETLSNGSYSLSNTFSGLNNPFRVAVDASGNVYIADTGSNTVWIETLSGASYAQTAVATGLNGPRGVAVDVNGNVYIADQGSNTIWKETLSGASYSQTALVTGLDLPRAVAINGVGNLYIADIGDNSVYEVDFADAPALGFAQTAVGFTSLDSPQTITVNNFGNATLNFSGVSSATDFPLNSTGGQVCSGSTTLAANTSCTLPIDFTPITTNLSFSESLTLTDNSLNAASANQPIALSGSGIAPTITFTLPASTTLTAGTVGVAYSVSFQATGGAAPYSYTGNMPPGLTLANSGQISGTPTAVESAYSITVTATDANGFTGSQIYSLTIGQGTATFNITPYSATYDANAHTATGTATGWSSLDLSAGLTLTGTTHTSAGNYPSDAWSFHDTNGNYADASGTVSDQIAQATATFGFTPYSVTYDANPHTATGTATGVSGANLSGGLNFLGTTHTNAGTYPSDAWSFHDAANNYADAGGTISDSIGQAAATILVTGYAVNYDGNAHSATAVATGVGAVNLSADVNLSGTAHTSVGSYTDPWSFTDPTGNYAPAGGTVSDSIAQVTATATAQVASSFGAVSLASSSTQLITFTFQTVGSVGTPVVVTAGATGLDFTDVGDGSCNTNGVSYDYGVSATCTVDVKFSPQYPGLRSGAVLLEDVSGNILATAYISGVGTGPMINFSPFAESTLNSNFTTPHGVAADASGNIYLADSTTGLVQQIAPGCTTSGCLKTLGGGFNQPQTVAFDGAGNVYVADYGNNAIKEVPSSCIAGANNNTCVLTLGTGFSFNHPEGVAVDAGGNVYVADTLNNAIEEMTPGCLNSSCVTSLGVGYSFNAPGGVAVDSSGNVYVADRNNGTVEEMTTGCTLSTCVTVLGGLGGSSGFTVPESLAVNGNGQVYVADGSALKVMPAGCLTSSCVTNTNGNFSAPYAVAIDQRGDILVADSGNQSIRELDYADAPSLSFTTTPAGTPSADSPRTVTVTNAGNASLVFSGESIATDFPLASTGGQVCSSSTTLVANTSCTLPIDFTPTTNTLLNESLTLDDNSLNLASSSQAIALNGTGTTPTITFTLPASLTLPPASVGVTYSGASFAATGGASPYAYTGTMPAGMTLSTGGVLSGTPAVAGAAINITVVATDNNGFTGTQNYTITVGRGAAAFSITPYTETYDGNAHTATGTATGDNNVDFSAGLTLTGTTHTNAGIYTDTWTFHDSTNTYADASGTVTDTIAKALATVNINSYSETFDGNAHTATGTASGVSGVNLNTDLNLTGTTHTNAGNYTTDTWTFSDASGNYQNSTGTITDVITKATATINVAPYSLSYDGNTHTATGTATGVGNVALSSSDFILTGTVHTNAGSYSTDAWTFSDASGNYQNASGTVTDVITKATATINVTPYSVSYDGNTHTATGTATGPGGVNLSGSDFTLTGTIHINAGNYTTDTWSFSDASGNYQNATGTVTDVISKALATINVTPYSVSYDGSSHTATGTATGAGGVVLSGSDFTLAGTIHTNAGSYTTDTWTFSDASGNYQNSTGTITDTISKALATINVTPYNVTYDGSPHTATGTATGPGGVVLSGSDLTLAGTMHTNAGNYTTDTWSFSDASGNYQISNGTITDVISKAMATVNVTPYNVSYDGNSHTATGTATGPGGVVLSGSDITLAGTIHTNAGSYTTDTWSFSDASGNYQIANGTITDTISKALATINVTPYSVAYNGAAHTATGTATGAGSVNLNSDLILTGTTHTNAGSYTTDTWTFSDASGNYQNSTGTVTDSITKALATISVTPYSVAYDGTAHTATGTLTGAGGVTLNSSDLVLTGTTHTTAGSTTDTWTFSDASGNYQSATGTVTDVITKASATINVIPYSVAYDGTAHTATGTVTGAGGVTLNSSDLVLTGTTHTTAGSTIDTWTFSDASGNYQNSTGTITDVITKALATINVTPYNLTYDGNAHTATGTATGAGGVALNSSDLVLTGTTHTTAGSTTDTWTFSDASGNYQSSTGTITDVITKALATINVTPYSVAYDGTAHTATGSASGVGGANLNSDLVLTGTTHTTAGSTTDTWTFSDASGNYQNSTGTITDVITKALASINVTPYSVAYDGTAHTATGTATGAGGVVLNSSDLVLSGTTHTTVGSTTDTWTFSDASGNYQSSTGTITDVITKASATINVTPYSVAYDGNAHTATGTATGAGGVNLNSDLVLTGTTHTTAGSTTDTWSFSDASGNYQNSTGTITDVITKALASINVTPYSVAFDGNAHTATGTATGAGGVALNSSDLILTGTTHTTAGSTTDTWSFSDASGNYQNSTGTITDVITKASATINVTPYDVNYDGNAHTATGTATGAAGINLNSDLVLTGTTHTTAGSTTDTWTFSDSSGNYLNSTGTITDSISKASATIDVTPYNLTYDGNAHTATGTAIGAGGVALSNNDLVLTGTTHTSTGTYASDAWSFHDSNGNYADASGSVSDTIAKASATIDITPYSLIFDGNAHTATGTAIGAGGVALNSNDLVLTNTTHTNAGSYAGDTWSFSDASGNYVSSSGTTSDAIAKASATVNVTPYDVSYDGNAHTATGTATGAGGVGLNTSDLVLTGTTHSNPGTYASDQWSFSDPSGNYLNASGTVSDSINEASAKVTLGGLSQTYTGTSLQATASTTPSGLTVNITYTGIGGTVYSQSATPPTLAGSYTVVGTVSSADFTGSGTGTLEIGQAVSQVASLVSSLNPAMPGNSVILTATVTSTAGTPAGTVTFLDNTNTILGNVTLASGQAALTTTFTNAQSETNQITAVYSGDGNFLGATGGKLAESVTVFTLTPVSGSAATQTVAPGGSAVYSLNLLPTTGSTFPAAVTLSLSGLPAGATATITPAAWTALTSTSWSLPANTPITGVVLTIQVPATVATLDREKTKGAKLPPMLWGVLLLPFAIRLRRAGKRMRNVICLTVLLAFSAAAITTLSGCGGSSGSSTPTPTPTNYTITVTATSGAVSSNTLLYLNVN